MLLLLPFLCSEVEVVVIQSQVSSRTCCGIGFQRLLYDNIDDFILF
jgi:hypothetical protein